MLPSTHKVAELLFQIFVCIADAQKDIRPDQVQNLHNLMAKARWAKSATLREGLMHLRSNYTLMWTAYEADRLDVGEEVIAAHINAICSTLTSEEAAELKESLQEFIRRISQSASSPISVIVGSAASDARSGAVGTIEKMLRGGVEIRPIEEELADEPSGPEVIVGEGRPAGPSSHVTISGANVWRGGRIAVRCVRVTQETHDVRTFSFVGVEPCLFQYNAGQFMTIELPVDGRVLRRSYTISSSPSRPHLLSVTVKRAQKGWVSNWLHDTLREGMECHVSGPFGDFTYADHPADKILLLGAGSGITPMMSILRYLADTANTTDVVLLNSVRSMNDVIFEREFTHLSAQAGAKFRIATIPSVQLGGGAWNGLIGHLSESYLTALVPDLLEREIFMCGPAGYMASAREILSRAGVPAHRIHDESFGGAPALVVPPPRAIASAEISAPPRQARITETAAVVAEPVRSRQRAAAGTVELVFEDRNVSVRCGTDDLILEAGEAAGLALNHSCRSGACGTCKLRKSSGTVVMQPQRFLNEEEINEGYFLACISRAQSRVVIEG